MAIFDKYLGDTYDLVDLIKDTEKSFVALVYDKYAKRLCAMKQRDLRSLDLYKILKESDNIHIPQIYRLLERDDKLIVIEEHIDGQTLDELLTYQISSVDEKMTLNILKQLCECLAPLHKANIIHRDIKPANIMLTKDNVIKLIDFGIARIFKPDSLTDTEFLGTRGYAAPEQFGLFDFGQSDPRTDIYSLGITIKILLGDNYHGWLNPILKRCTSLDPNFRYQSIDDLLKDIDKTRIAHILKKISIYAFIFAAAIILSQFISFDKQSQDVDTNQEIETPAGKSSETIEQKLDTSSSITQSSSSNLNQDVMNQLIEFSKTPSPIYQYPDYNINEINDSQLPQTPQADSSPDDYAIEIFDNIKGLFYLNGNLTDEYHMIYLHKKDGWQSWQKNADDTFLFPNDWYAAIRIVNQRNEDLINPHLTISFEEHSYAVDKPTIRAGQYLDLNIPLANECASRLEGYCDLDIAIDFQNGDIPTLYIHKTFYLAD